MLPEMTTHKEDQPVTTRDGMLNLSDYLLFAANNTKGCLYSQRKKLTEAAAALRLASRQEVSVTVEELATLLIDCWKSGKAPLQVARALLAEYSITKRTTEG